MNKSGFKSRIKSASPAGLVALTLEIASCRVSESLEGGGVRERNLALARKAIYSLIEALDFEFPISRSLLDIYLGVNKLLCLAAVRADDAPALKAQEAIEEMAAFWRQAEKIKAPGRPGKVFVGLTYKGAALEECAATGAMADYKA
jgi:flagellin-specific chaperone FliS